MKAISKAIAEKTLAEAKLKGLTCDKANYFYLKESLNYRLNLLKEFFPSDTLHAIAIKTNSHPEVLKYIASKGFGLEAASIEEVKLAQKAGVPSNKIVFDSPRDALDIGIGTVYQDLALVSLMSVTRNFFMGREPQKGIPFLKTFDVEKANKIAAERMGQIGIDVRDPSQAVGTMSGGERQCLAISRAIYFGAKVLVLDEPTSALGVHQASMVLKYIVKAASEGLAVILITHNVHHAYPVGNSFTVLNRGRSMGTFQKKDISREKLLSMMAGGEELDKLEVELKEMDRVART